MVKYTPLERSSLSSLICQPVVFFSVYSSSIHHQSIIINSSSKFTWWTFFTGALSFYELKEGRVYALVRLVLISSSAIAKKNIDCSQSRPSGKSLARCVEGPEFDFGHNFFLFASFRLVIILGITVLYCFYISTYYFQS